MAPLYEALKADEGDASSLLIGFEVEELLFGPRSCGCHR